MGHVLQRTRIHASCMSPTKLHPRHRDSPNCTTTVGVSSPPSASKAEKVKLQFPTKPRAGCIRKLPSGATATVAHLLAGCEAFRTAKVKPGVTLASARTPSAGALKSWSCKAPEKRIGLGNLVERYSTAP